jgi:hypothetical protein
VKLHGFRKYREETRDENMTRYEYKEPMTSDTLWESQNKG